MEEYLKIPYWIKNIKDIKSKNIISFLDGTEITENKISLEYIRTYYKNNSENFSKLIDELTLRGFEFKSLKKNNILPALNFSEEQEVIISLKSDKNYESIDFEKLQLSNFVSRFKIEDDLCFHLIPLKGFFYLNKSIDLNILKSEFQQKGFTIKKIFSQEKSFKEEYSIENCFFESAFKSFKEFCKENQISSVVQIKKDHLEKLKEYPGIGVGRIKKISEKLREVLNVLNLYEKETELFSKEKEQLQDPLLIENYLAENKYNKFQKFLAQKGINKVTDITKEHIEEYKNSKGIGAGKYQDALNVFNEIINLDYREEQIEINDLDEEKINFDKKILEEIGEMTVGEYISFYLEQEEEKYREIKISDLNGMTISQLQEIDVPEVVIKYIKNYRTIESLCGLIEFKDVEKEIFEKRYRDKKTLIQIGEEFSVTRSRIEQIVAKNGKLINNIFNLYGLRKMLKIKYRGISFIPAEDIGESLGENRIFLNFLKDNKFKGAISYYEPLDGFVLDKFDDTSIKEFVENLPDFFCIDDYLDEIADLLSSVNEKTTLAEIESVLKFYGYEQRKKYFKLSKIPTPNVISIIFKEFLDGPLKLDEIGVREFNRISKEYFDEEIIGDAVRNFEAVLERAENVVLINQSTYIHSEKIKVPQEFIDIVGKYIEESLSEREFINVSLLLQNFGEEFEKIGLNNKYGAASFIRLFYEDRYKIKTARIGDIYKVGSEVPSREEQLKKVVQLTPGKYIKDYAQILQWPELKVLDTIAKSKTIYYNKEFKVGNIEELKLTKEEISLLKSFTLMNIKDGYSTVMKLLKEMKFSFKINEVLRKWNLYDINTLQFLLKTIIPEIEVNRYFISEKKFNYKNILDVFEEKFQDEVDRTEVQEFIRELEYSISFTVDKYIKEKLFMETGPGKILVKSKFFISDEDLKIFLEYINQEIGSKEYISLNKLSGYRKILPVIDFRWNPYLMRSILCDYGYKAIYKKNGDYRYDKVILVREESKIEDMESLIYHILKNEYNENLNEMTVIDYLNENEIIYNPPYSKKLPYEIYNSDKIRIDEIGVITLE